MWTTRAQMQLLARTGSRRLMTSSSASSSSAAPSLASMASTTGHPNRIMFPNLYAFIKAYRVFGHRAAHLDALGMAATEQVPELDPRVYGLVENLTYPTEGLLFMPGGAKEATLEQIVRHLDETYCSAIGAEIQHAESNEEREWLQRELESKRVFGSFSPGERRNMFRVMTQAESIDHFLGVKFASFKRYGLEGAEAVIPGLQTVLQRASDHGMTDMVVGMPHRGRLNMMLGLFQYSPRSLFSKMKGKSDLPLGMGGVCDVVSHLGISTTKTVGTNKINITLMNNPSHLEAINPVAQGKTRARQDGMSREEAQDRVMCLQLHGDAAFIGQGIVPESLLLANVPHFRVGGTMHIIVNNQIGFTTQAINGRSSRYSSDHMKLIAAPVLHVNAENPEAVVRACHIAADYRAKFKRDVMVDIVGYRRHGHNEVDEPGFTQPRMYRNIRSRHSVVQEYGDRLRGEGVLRDVDESKIRNKVRDLLEEELNAAEAFEPPHERHFQGKWKGFGPPTDMTAPVDTGVDVATLADIGEASVTVPDDFKVHDRLKRMHIHDRITKCRKDKKVDWATAEALAWGSLLTEGYNVRISGQDVERGTFSHRHGVLVDQEDERYYCPLNHIKPGEQGRMDFAPSPLSEFSVLGFEYGYSLEDPRNMCIWEAQFGDFFNGAQIVVDTFITGSEAKWMRQTGLVMLLPHGFDGAGPEHSSCRIERFLQLTDGDERADDQKLSNLIVANCTTPANYFHLLRRQMKTKYRRPLVLAAPKTLLRHQSAMSDLDEMGPGTTFQPVMTDLRAADPTKVNKVIFCSGKISYDLLRHCDSTALDDVAVVRLEELAPFPFKRLQEEVSRFTAGRKPGDVKFVWAQEEPLNGGPWTYVNPRLRTVLRGAAGSKAELLVSARDPLPTPAVGYGRQHKVEADHVIQHPFAL